MTGRSAFAGLLGAATPWAQVRSFAHLGFAVRFGSLRDDMQDIIGQLVEGPALTLKSSDMLIVTPFSVAAGYAQIKDWKYDRSDERSWTAEELTAEYGEPTLTAQEAMNDSMRDGEPLAPIVVQGDEVLDGRHRLRAAHALKLKVIPAIDIAQFVGRGGKTR